MEEEKREISDKKFYGKTEGVTYCIVKLKESEQEGTNVLKVRM